MNFQRLTPDQQRNASLQFRNDFRSAINNGNATIQNISDIVEGKLMDAANNHKLRRQEMNQEFLATLRNSTISLGCNSTCYDVCSRYSQGQYFVRCLNSQYCNTCFNNVVTITPGNNTLGISRIVAKEYGDVNQLSYADYKDISQSLMRVRVNSV